MINISIKKNTGIIVKALVIISAIIGLILMAETRPTERVSVNEYIDTDVVYTGGSTAHFESKNFGALNRGDVATVHLHLPEKPAFSDSVLAFHIYHSVTVISCDGKVLDKYGGDIDARDDMVGNVRFLTEIPPEAWGHEISITLRATENNAFSQIKNVWVYPKQSAYQYYIDSDFTGFFIGLPLLLVGLISLLAFILNDIKNDTVRKGLYISSLYVLASFWLLGSSGAGHLIGFHGYFWSYVEFVAMFLISIPVLLYTLETEEKHSLQRRILGALACLQFGYFILAVILNILNIAHYCSTIVISEYITLISGVLILISAMRQIRRSTGAALSFFAGTVILIITGVMDLLHTNVEKFLPELAVPSMPSVFPVGVLFFSLCILRTYYVETVQKERAYLTKIIKAENSKEMLEYTPAGICMFALHDDYPIILANDMFFSIFGYTKQTAETAGFDNLLYFLDSEERTKLKGWADSLMNSECESSNELELNVKKSDGHKAVILAKFYYHGNDDGRVTANVIDITDRKRVEDELRVSEERYKLALTQSGKVFFFFDVYKRTMHLSAELAELFGLPLEVDNMPDNFLSRGLVEKQSENNYRDFYRRIIAGEPSGDTIISCHMRQAPDTVLWYKISFTSVFDVNGKPASAVIIYEDLQEQRAREIAGRWKQLNLVTVPEKEYVIAEYNLTANRILSQVGGLFSKMPEFITGYDEINRFVCDHFIYEDDVEAYRTFLDRNRILEMFESGKTEDSIEYRSLQRGSDPRWTRTSIQIIRDPYSSDVLGQLLFQDINTQRAGQIEMMQNVEELRKELENSRIKVMINQMQPHFLYNALSAIQTIVKSDPDYAYQLIYDFTVHLRSSIKALSSDAPIPFSDELKNIKAYLNIERMRFGDSLQVKYEIDCDCFCVIPLSIQPLAENAARHGVYPKGDDGGTVTVRTYETENAYVVEVEDDGVGFDVDAELSKPSDSVGLKSLIFRLKSLMDADVIIESKLGSGTKATVQIPKKEMQYYAYNSGRR